MKLAAISQTTPEERKAKLINSAVGGAAGVAIGLGTAYTASNISHRTELKDKFESAKKAVKEAKNNNLGKEGIKEVKKGLKDLKSKVRKDSLKTVKQVAIPILATGAAIIAAKDLIIPAVKEYLSGKETVKADDTKEELKTENNDAE